MKLNLAQAIDPATGFHWDTTGVGLLKYGVVFVLVLAVAWMIYSIWTTFKDEHERHNRPFWTIRLGALTGTGFAASPLLAIKTDPWWEALLYLGLGGVALGLLFWLLALLFEWFVTRVRPHRDSSRTATMPQAYVLSALLAAAGWIVGQLLPSPDSVLGFSEHLQILGFFTGVGFGLIVLVWLVFGNVPLFPIDIDGVKRRVGLNKFNRHNETTSGAKILASGILATGWILRNALDGPFQGYSNGLQDMLILFLNTMLILLVAVVVADKFLLHDRSIVDVVVDDHRDDANTLSAIILVLAYAGNWLVL